MSAEFLNLEFIEDAMFLPRFLAHYFVYVIDLEKVALRTIGIVLHTVV